MGVALARVAAASPVPVHNFDRIPVITAGPYEYGDPDAPPVADLGGAAPWRRGS